MENDKGVGGSQLLGLAVGIGSNGWKHSCCRGDGYWPVATSILSSFDKEEAMEWVEPEERLTKLKERVQQRGWQTSRKARIKEEVLAHYGGGKLACVKCGFGDIRALSLDHINGRPEGTNPRNRDSRGGKGVYGQYGYKLYINLRTDGYPDGFQTLCMNCQFIKKFENRELNQW